MKLQIEIDTLYVYSTKEDDVIRAESKKRISAYRNEGRYIEQTDDKKHEVLKLIEDDKFILIDYYIKNGDMYINEYGFKIDGKIVDLEQLKDRVKAVLEDIEDVIKYYK